MNSKEHMLGLALTNRERTTIHEANRFAIVAVGVLVAINISTTYALGLISTQLRDQFGFNQGDITTISTVGMCFGYLSFPAGILYDYFGPSVVLVLATAMSAGGMFLLSAIFAGHVPGTLASVVFANCLLSMGCSWQDVSSLMTSILNFPLDKGSVVAIQKTFMGLGATILSLYYQGLFNKKYSEYAFFVGVMIAFHGVLAVALIQIPAYHIARWRARHMSEEEARSADDLFKNVYERQPGESKRFMIGFVLLAIAVVFFATVSFVEAYVTLTADVKRNLAAVSFLITISFFSMAIPFSALPSDRASVNDVLIPIPLRQNEPRPFVTTSFFFNLRRERLVWLLWWTSLCNWGAGVVVISNSSQIYTAVNNGVADNRQDALIVAILGVTSALGRIAAGALEQLLARRGKSVTDVYCVTSIATVVAFILFQFVDCRLILIPFGVMSFGFGFSWATTILIVRQTFSRDIGQHYNYCFFAAILSTVVFNRVLFGPFYDNEAREQGTYPVCSGHQCFATTFFVIAAMGISSVFSSVGFSLDWHRRKKSCANMIPLE